jgi:hypothetical protein
MNFKQEKIPTLPFNVLEIKKLFISFMDDYNCHFICYDIDVH